MIVQKEINTDLLQLRSKLQGSFLLFCQYFYKHLQQRDFILSNPYGRESHFITCARALTKCARLESMKLILNLPPGHGKPLCKTTKLLTIDGNRKQLGDIEVGDQVLTHRGRFRKVLRLFHQGMLETIKIKTFSGREIISAYDHSFLTANGWLQAKDLTVDTCLGISIPLEDFGSYVLPEEARLLGYLIGDGCVSGSSCNVTACDDAIIADIQHCCEVMGFTYERKFYGLQNRPAHHNQNTSRINISGAREWIKMHGIEGKNSYTKMVPEFIMRSNANGISNFIGAYFACDGTFGKKHASRRDFSVSMTSVSRKILEDCQHLLSRIGIRSRIRTKVSNIKTIKQGDLYTSYNLELGSQDDVYNFKRLIGHNIYHSKIERLNSHVFIRQRFDSQIHPDHIVSIEKNGLVDCMCIEVEEDHTFTANDIIVHNSTLLVMWVAWTMSIYPDSQYMYISYSKKIATKQTELIKRIISLKEYQLLFGIKIQHDSKAKEYFKNTHGGTVAAFGASGSITGFDAGLPGLDRFSGALIVDDAHKPDEVHSDTIREGVIQNYKETVSQRVRGINVPIIFLGQRLHEGDLPAFLLDEGDGTKWENVVLKSLDDAENALYPEAFPKEMLLTLREFSPYVYASQHQQNPIPAGGALFRPEYFPLLDQEPEMIMTFITADTAETDKNYNDATVFSFFGLYKLNKDQFALHWIDCVEIRVEPKDLKDAFMDFWTNCSRYKTPPLIAIIEKKSSGSTLLSLLSNIRGIDVRDVKRENTKSKTQRFLDIQPYVYAKFVSMPEDGRHVEMCITHMSKITANNSHRFDDICDTLADACKIAFIDKALYYEDDEQHEILEKMQAAYNVRNNVISRSNRSSGFSGYSGY